MTPHPTDRLSEYLDGELAPRDRAAVERHLAGCEECAIVLAELRTVASRAGALEPAASGEDLWAAIETRLEPRAAAPNQGRTGRAWPRFSFSIPQLVGAAAALVAVSSGAMWFTLGGRPAAPAGPGAVAGSGVSGSMAAVAAFDEAHYGPAIRELEDALRLHRAELDTSTVRILEQNLALIDRATEEARRALIADPRNPYLSGHLAAQLKKKVWLLQRATAVVTAQG